MLILLARSHEFHVVALAYCAVDDFEVCDDASERVEHRVENQSLERSVRVAYRCRHTLHYGLQNLGHAHSGFAAGADYLVAFASQQVDYLILHLVGVGRVKIAFIDYRYYLQIVVDGHVQVRYSLSLYALRRIHYKQRTLARGNAARHLVGEIERQKHSCRPLA